MCSAKKRGLLAIMQMWSMALEDYRGCERGSWNAGYHEGRLAAYAGAYYLITASSGLLRLTAHITKGM